MSAPDIDTMLSDLDALAATNPLDERAAKAIREMREDFYLYGEHNMNCPKYPRRERVPNHCSCGLDSARARWGVR